ncbi:PadR family transcriptional regulator [Actinokineospora iranica]|uniref:DNA-binding transcriptional regulator, PadR family n=1 Tax=Actinokineospora iranica TaxID=1271860 RepID=A0A1G6TK06_9PSEU|nr:PadR family transcriptional regulator [Actinokineospora iranica]SDD29204.1 DNA-binding transcriptional regulator, PadR family [Actinokineospora iranica]
MTTLPSEPTPGPRARKLNATSYVVLGMLSHGPATSYDLKQRVGYTVGNFWAFAHSQLYDEPARLAEDGLVTASIEDGGRRRRTYSITQEGRDALREWLGAPTPEQTEVRDLGLLKLFFATFGDRADLVNLARTRRDSHRSRADGYIAQHERIVDYADPWQVKSLELGIRIERCVEEFWAEFVTELETGAAD